MRLAVSNHEGGICSQSGGFGRTLGHGARHSDPSSQSKRFCTARPTGPGTSNSSAYASISVVLTVAILLGACSDARLCGDDAGGAYIEVDAAELAKADSQLRVCVNDLCNAEDSSTARVEVAYSEGEHPSLARWSVARLSGANRESLAGGEVDIGCSNDPTSVRIVVDSEGESEVFWNLLLPGL